MVAFVGDGSCGRGWRVVVVESGGSGDCGVMGGGLWWWIVHVVVSDNGVNWW